jgi:hypothetical protein
MTREEIEKEYRVVGATIISPGKFEGCPVYTPAFWDLGIGGTADEADTVELDGDTRAFVFHIDASDVERWPELQGVRKLRLVEDGNGFVHVFKENY